MLNTLNKYYLILLLFTLSLPLNNLLSDIALPDIKALLPASMPNTEALDNSASKADILAHNLWDKERGQIVEAAKANANATPEQTKEASNTSNTNWQLKAVKMPDIAIIKTAKGMQHYTPRQTLPGGEVLHEIFIDGIVLEKNSEKQNVYLFGKKPKPHH